MEYVLFESLPDERGWLCVLCNDLFKEDVWIQVIVQVFTKELPFLR